jgi:sulfur-oxidizing protein SoxB
MPGADITREHIQCDVDNVPIKRLSGEMTGSLFLARGRPTTSLMPTLITSRGGDMVRVGGMGYPHHFNKPIGERSSEMTLLKTGERLSR